MKKIILIILIILGLLYINNILNNQYKVNSVKKQLIGVVKASEIKKVVTPYKEIKDEQQGFYTEIKWGKYNQPVQVFDTQVNEMIKRGYSLTRILDLLTIKTMECNRYDGRCFNGNDVGHFQINKIHKLQYIKSHELFYNGAELFKYQLTYADALLSSYMDRFCDWKRSKNNKNRWKCIAYSYNGHPRYKYTYAKLGREKRKLISEYIIKNYPLLTN